MSEVSTQHEPTSGRRPEPSVLDELIDAAFEHPDVWVSIPTEGYPKQHINTRIARRIAEVTVRQNGDGEKRAYVRVRGK